MILSNVVNRRVAHICELRIPHHSDAFNPIMSPPPNPRSASKDGRMALAVQAYQDGHFTSKRSAANTYDVPESSFRYRVAGHPARRDSKPTNRKLTDTEESVLVQWISSID